MPVVHRRVDKKKPGKGWWSDKEKHTVVSAYLLLGKLGLVAATTGVPELTIRKWRMAPWWKEMEDEIKRSSKIELSGKLTDVVNKTLIQLEDRVSNGDFFFNNKSGKFERKPVDARVASKVVSDLIDRTLILEKEASKEKSTDESIELRLGRLKEEMLKFVKGTHVDESKVIDVSPIIEKLPSDAKLS